MRRVGEYELVRELARGGMGQVWIARDPAGREVAVKLLLEAAEERERERFAREAEALGRLAHPRVVRVHRFGRDAGRDYLVLDLVAGESLAARLKRDGPLAPEAAARLARDLADALAAAHAVGVLHRDVKPGNVLLRAEDGAPVLTDFGLARIDDQSQRLTQTGTTHGTPAYMPPEQAEGDLAQLGPPSDVYGLGATLFKALTGQPPFTGATPINVVHAILSRPAPRVTELRPEVPPALEAIVRRCLAKSPSQRYASAAALRDALDGFLAGEGDAPARRGGWVALAAVAVLVAVALGVRLATRGSAPESAVSTQVAPAPAPSPTATDSPRATPAPYEALEHPSWGTPPEQVGVRWRPGGRLLSWALHRKRGATIQAWTRELQPATRWTFRGERVHDVAVARRGERVVALLGPLDRPGPREPLPEGRRIVELHAEGRSTLRLPQGPVFSAVALSPDGRRLALGAKKRGLYRVEVHTGAAAEEWGRFTTPVRGLAFTSRGELLAVGGDLSRKRRHWFVHYDPQRKRVANITQGQALCAVVSDGTKAWFGGVSQVVHEYTPGPVPEVSALSVIEAPGSHGIGRVTSLGTVQQLRRARELLFVLGRTPDLGRGELRIFQADSRRQVGGVVEFPNLYAFDVSADGVRVVLGLGAPRRDGPTLEVWPLQRLLTGGVRTRAEALKSP